MPKLQISIYHNLEDLRAIPQYINPLDASYRLFAGHHFMDPHESVIYAI